MRRTTLALIAVLVCASAVLLSPAGRPAYALPLGQVQAVIASPSAGQEVRGQAAIIGSASVPGFQYYKVEYGVGSNPADWALVDRMYDTPVINNHLATWNTLAIPDGVYSLRLRVVKQDGNYEEVTVRGVVVANTRPIQTPTETATPTPTGTPEGAATETPPPGGPTAGGPTPTATQFVIAPEGQIAPPTATPTIGAPAGPASSMPFNLDPQGWWQGFVSGMIAMGAAVVVLGIVFLVRRLL